MRKLHDRGYFENCMQAEIEKDKQLDEMDAQIDGIRAELQVILKNVYALSIIFRVKSSPSK